DVGKEERVDVEETEDGKERAREKKERGKDATAPGFGFRKIKRRREQPQGGQRKKPLRQLGRIDRPMRVNENEIGGPDEFPEVKPQHAPREQATFEEVEREGGAFGADQLAFEMSGEKAAGETEGEPGKQWEDVA